MTHPPIVVLNELLRQRFQLQKWYRDAAIHDIKSSTGQHTAAVILDSCFMSDQDLEELGIMLETQQSRT